MPSGYMAYICEDAGGELAKVPWELLSSRTPKIQRQFVSIREVNKTFLEEACSKYYLVFLIARAQKENEIAELKTLVAELHRENLFFFLIIPGVKPSLSDDRIQLVDANIQIDFLVSYLDRCMTLAYYQHKYRETAADENQWLRRIEKIFALTREEIINSDQTAKAYENLLLYEEQLLQEQRRVNQALESLQEYRDRHKKDWLQEREAREALENLMSRELKDRTELLKAQEMLLQYTAKERETLYALMKLLKEKGSLSREEVEELLEKQNVLLKDVERLIRLRESK
ncbi:MAG: hypothetical protein NZM25_02520 [Leptospiraceae bacterium]|nr:hypothetical protein [Leptospiraceae bacterium]